MTYEILINTVSEIVNNGNINKDGLTLTYTLPDDIHKSFNEELFYKTQTVGVNFTPTDEYEVEIGGVLIKFLKKNS
jgi:maltoporin